MLAKLTSKNQLTLPKSVTQAVGAAEYFDVWKPEPGRSSLPPCASSVLTRFGPNWLSLI